jgi:glycosyltransferase involved in cell wall biosynthesis
MIIMKNKRILVISDLPIFPANAGNKARIWSLMNNLRDLGHEVWFLGLGLNHGEGDLIRKEWGDCVHIIPPVRIRAAKPRTYALRRWLFGRLVSRDLYNPDVDFWYWPHWDGQIKAFAAKHEFDVVIAEYVFFSKALLNFGEDVMKVIDTHDVFTDRQKKHKERNIKRCFKYLSRTEEAKGLARADRILAIQKHEAAFFRQMTGGSKPVITVGTTINLSPLAPPTSGPPTMLFLATDYSVNIDGLNHFIEHCLPLICAAVPNAKLLVAGSICRVLKMESPAIEKLGEVKELREAYERAHVVINPVLVGTGLKTKTVEALGFGKPLVTTACGAEGLEEAAGSAFLLGESPKAFADGVIRLLTDHAEAQRIAAAAFDFARKWNRDQTEALKELTEEKQIA